MGRDALLNDCAQHLRQSSFEFEQLLGSSVDTVWQALGCHVERQLLAKKGVNVALLGKFAFLREVQPLVPVFILADRFVSSYGAAWKRPPPALLTPTVDVNLSVVGGEVGLPKEQTLRTLEALVVFLGSKLQKGSASGRLRLGNVGSLCFDGKALSFAFNSSFVKAVNQGSSCSSPSGGVGGGGNTKSLQRSMSTNSGIPVMRRATAPSVTITNIRAPPPVSTAQELNSEQAAEQTHSSSSHHHKKTHVHRRERHESTSKPHRHHTRSSTHLDAPARVHGDASDRDIAARPVLPRFMVASKSVPDDAKVNRQTPGSPYALALEAAFERERELRAHNALAIAAEDAAIARRYHATQLGKLQESAERAIHRRELNTFLNRQIEEKHAAQQRAEALIAARASDTESATILPLGLVVTAEAQRDAKRNLCKRLDDQVVAKDALARDRRALEQAEAAYFTSKLKAQTDAEQREALERKRRDKQELLDGWRQQQALRADAPAAFSAKRIR